MWDALPQKNILQAIIFAFGVVLISVLVRFGEKATPSEKNIEEISQKASVQRIIVKDTDSDGLADWEEALWGTNPRSKDSDGDGKSDKLFVDEKRSVLVGTTGLKTALATTTSNVLGRQLFATLVSLNQQGSLNEKTVDSLTQAFAKNIGGEGEAINISIDKINLVSGTPETRRVYKEKLVATFSLYKNVHLGEELVLFGKAIKSGDQKDLALLEKNNRVYTALGEKLLVIPVPPEVAEPHTLLINSFRLMVKSLHDMEKIFTDPVTALFGINLYEKASSEALTQLQAIGLLIKEW